MKKIILPLLFLLSIPAMSQFASSKHKDSRGDFEFARTTYGNPMFDNASTFKLNDAGTLRIGAYVGLLLSKLHEKNFDYSSNRAAVVFGALAMYQYTQSLYFMSGLLIALNGTRFDYDGADGFGYNLTTLLLPLLAGYAVMPELMVLAGFQLGFIMGAKDTEGDDLKDYLKGLDIGFKFGVMYQITELFTAHMFYTLGLTDLAESDQYDGDAIKSRMFEIGVGYRLFQKSMN